MVSRCFKPFPKSESAFIDDNSALLPSLLKLALVTLMTSFPPGPKSRYPGSGYLRFRKDPMGFLERMAHEFGDIVHWRIGRRHTFFINHPDLIQDVLVTNCKSFTKVMEASRTLLGQGLTASEGDLHRRQRRALQPAFHHERVGEFGKVMVTRAERAQSRWRDGSALDLKDEMGRISLAVVGETMFGVNLEPHAAAIQSAMDTTIGSPPNMLLPLAQLVEKLPLPKVRRMKAGRAKIHAVVDQLISERRVSAGERNDLLSILLFAQDQGNNGNRMTGEQVHDEVMNFLIGGHETVSDALGWTWYLLSLHPEVEARLHEELDRILGDRLPSFADMEALRFTKNVTKESLRLYPPLWMIWRRAVEDYPLGDYIAPAGSIVLLSQHVMHRDQRYFAEPLRFNPERWTQEFNERLPKFAYFPFGGGPRQCIGDRFGFMEVILVIATVAQKWKFRLVPGYPVVPHPLLTLRPKYGLRMTAHRRNR
jgi:cytochrome P450